MNRPKICIVGLKCYDLIAGAEMPRFIGGIETQLVLLAKGLLDEGSDVSLIVYDQGQAPEEIVDGVKVLKAYDLSGGIRGFRWIDRARSLWAAMRRADADIYLQMGAGVETGLVGLGCNRVGTSRRHFIYCLASDLDYSDMLSRGRLGWEGKAYLWGLRRADLVVAQTERQRQGLQKAVGVNALVMPMAAPHPVPTAPASNGEHNSRRVLWVGRAAKEKRLEWLLELARHCPEFQFQVIGTANSNTEYATRVLGEARQVPNLELVGRVAGQDMHAVYQNARILCNTSIREGFPTTFLEAWSYGLPVVTTFDPDDIVARNGLGRVSSTVNDQANALRELHADSEAYGRISQAAKSYYNENHAISAVSRRFRVVFDVMLGQRQPVNECAVYV
ncbi:MAG: glycosyltransferase family 4 protein [Chthoniobacterales bacterium]